jgi:methyl-accepting chemotaxis protein
VEMQNAFLKMVSDGKIEEAKANLVNAVRGPQRDYLDAVAELIAFQGKLMEQAGQEATDTYHAARTLRRRRSKSGQGRGQLLAAMQTMVAKLVQIITEVRSASDNLSSASEEVSATAQSLSQGLPSRPLRWKKPAPASNR